jgi:formylglycine-generating enzyme required for sulfatase activity
MGASREDLDRIAKELREDWQKTAITTEAPPRPVKIGAPFYLAECEVPVRAFRAFVKATGYRTTAETNGKGGRRHVGGGQIEQRPEWTWQHTDFTGSEDLPVVEISLKDAEAFCAWLSKKEGRQYVVPNEQQWEYACRAGTTTRWWNGDDEGTVSDVAWTQANAALFKSVGLKPGNPFGLRDMHGNVEEVCSVVGGGAVARGGTHGSPPLLCRSASRFPIPDDEVWAGRGFRVAIVGDLKPKAPPPAPEVGPAPRVKP